MAIKGFIEVDEQRCKGCQLCATVCPVQAIGYADKTNEKGYYFAKMINDKCIGCASCAEVCPDSVITVFRKKRVKK